MTHAQEIEIRERAARETFEVDQLRGLAQRWLRDSMRALSTGRYKEATEWARLATDLQLKALELEGR